MLDTIFQEAGLVDASGAPTTPANFGKAPEPDRDEAIDWDKLGMSDEAPKQAADPQPQERAQGNQGQGAEGEQPQPFQVEQQPRQQISPEQAATIGLSQIERQYNEAIQWGLSQLDAEGKPLFSLQELHQRFAPQRQALEAQLRADLLQHRMAPYAQRMVAEDIGKRYGVDPSEIAGEGSAEAMEAAAKHIARLSRDAKFQERRASGKDSVEGGRGMSAVASEAYEKLSPQQKIKYGLMRGDR